jgi:hypothetical protein
MKRYLFYLLIALICLYGCTLGKKGFEQDYPMFAGEEHVFEKVSFSDARNLLTSTNGSHILLLAFDPDFYECPFCFTCLPLINAAAIDQGIGKINYLDIYQMRKENTADYRWLLDKLKSCVSDLRVKNGETFLAVPDLYIIQDGKILGHHIATFENETGGYISDLSDKQKEDLKTLYRDLFRLLS